MQSAGRERRIAGGIMSGERVSVLVPVVEGAIEIQQSVSVSLVAW